MCMNVANTALMGSQDPETHMAGSLTVVEFTNNLAQKRNIGLIALKPFNNNIIASSLTCLLEGPHLNSNNLTHLI